MTKSHNIVKKSKKKCIFMWMQKRHSNVNLSDRKLQASVKKEQKYKFLWQKVTNWCKEDTKNVNLSKKKKVKT